MHILVINGPNMNMLGIRQPEIYGRETYEDLCAMLRQEAEKLGVDIRFFQSNHEGALVDAIQQAYFDHVDGIIINPAAYTHTSVALLDAVKAVGIPTVVDAATLAADLLEEAGVEHIDADRLRQGQGNMMVTPRDIDAQVRDLSKVVGYGINWALQDLDVEDITALLS